MFDFVLLAAYADVQPAAPNTFMQHQHSTCWHTAKDCMLHLSSDHVTMYLLSIITLAPFGPRVCLVAQMLHPGRVILCHLPIQALLTLLSLCEQSLSHTQPAEYSEELTCDVGYMLQSNWVRLYHLPV